jgi:hypothetical protein
MNAVVVAYRWTAAKSGALSRMLDGLIPFESVVVVENHPQPSWDGGPFLVIQGSNRFAEFSGYHEGLNKVESGPVLVLNDTALAHHSITFWRLQINQWMNQVHEGIQGDPRHEQLKTEYGQLTYFASWIFWLPSTHDVDQFNACLLKVFNHWDEVFSPNSKYRSFINTYLRGSLFHGWKNAGLRDQKAQDLKIRCIWAEHRLSKLLIDQGCGVHNLRGPHVFPMRSLDRFFSFRRRVQSFLK